MIEGVESCLLLDLKLSQIQIFKGPAAKVLGETTDSLGMAEADQVEVVPNSQLLLTPTISMPCHKIMRYSPWETLSYLYSSKTTPKITAAMYS